MIDELMLRVGARFRRAEPRRARTFVLGLLAGLPRKNCRALAVQAGEASPDGMQHLLERARWDVGGVRDDVRDYVTGRLGDPGAVLVVDETGDVKKGTTTAGVQRQYTGTAGKFENAQVAVYLTYAAPGGHALIDRELYLPQAWVSDPARCQAAGIPADARFATRPQLAQAIIGRAATPGVPFGWAAADEAYGDNGPLREWLEGQQIAYVLASHRAGRRPHRARQGTGCFTGAAATWKGGGPGSPGSTGGGEPECVRPRGHRRPVGARRVQRAGPAVRGRDTRSLTGADPGHRAAARVHRHGGRDGRPAAGRDPARPGRAGRALGPAGAGTHRPSQGRPGPRRPVRV
jgi:hypothetical protein